MTKNQFRALLNLIAGFAFFVIASFASQIHNLKVFIKGPDVTRSDNIWIYFGFSVLYFIMAVWCIIDQRYDEKGKPL